tara:strand:+ start:2177 stop:2935 length:759 start_codon:yes stop_codon:yes gene_type:complete
MTVHFIGAGPGAADLITLRGLRLIQKAPVILFAGSLVPKEVLSEADPNAQVLDTAPMHLDEIIREIEKAHLESKDVARVHSGDPSVYGAVAEQMRRLDNLGIDYDVTPGVAAYSAVAAALKLELTLPSVSQTIILTRTSVRSSTMPVNENLVDLGRTGATLAIHLSINNLAKVVRDLTPVYGKDCPVIIAYRVSWPDETFVFGTLLDIREKVKKARITRTALILVGRVFANQSFTDSCLYSSGHSHILRRSE